VVTAVLSNLLNGFNDLAAQLATLPQVHSANLERLTGDVEGDNSCIERPSYPLAGVLATAAGSVYTGLKGVFGH
jgi:hypothetical protein